MTVYELANNWIENDLTGDYCRHITETDAAVMIRWMDPETIDALDEQITPENFAEEWNRIICDIENDRRHRP